LAKVFKKKLFNWKKLPFTADLGVELLLSLVLGVKYYLKNQFAECFIKSLKSLNNDITTKLMAFLRGF
jgi:hypothetical protein